MKWYRLFAGSQRWLRVVAVLCIVSVLLPVAGKPAYALSASDNPYDVTFRLEQLYVVNAQEDGLFSDGDEPYFAVIGFRSTVGKPGSTSTFWSGYLEEDWANGVDDGDWRNVPEPMGSISFPDVYVRSLLDIRERNLPEVLGVVIISVESDATPFGIIRNGLDQLCNALRDELERLIAQQQLSNPETDMPQVMASIQERIEPSVWESMGIWFASFSDPDDPISVQSQVYVAADPMVSNLASLVGYPTSGRMLEEHRFEVGVNPLVFEGDGARYEVTASVRATPKGNTPCSGRPLSAILCRLNQARG